MTVCLRMIFLSLVIPFFRFMSSVRYFGGGLASAVPSRFLLADL
jgi:hypothetical protein